MTKQHTTHLVLGSLVLVVLSVMGTVTGLAQDSMISGYGHRNYCSLDLKVKTLLAQKQNSTATTVPDSHPLQTYLRVDSPRPYARIG